ncbi:molybdopterin molybdotransferase MoeA [Arthrobacter monumenti]
MPATVAEHQRRVLELLRPLATLGAETVPLAGAVHRVLAEELPAPISLPSFDNSQMDGYAVRSSDLADAGHGGGSIETVTLSVGAAIPAGVEPAPLEPGYAAPIMTGAMLPQGADAVVPIEQASPDTFFPDNDGGSQVVALPTGTPPDQFVRRTGSDIAAGATAMRGGTVLQAPQLGLLAAFGMAEVKVRKRPTVLLLATGDEVVQPGEQLPPGRIYDANTTLLRTSLEVAGVLVRNCRLVTDEVGPFLDQLRRDLREGHVDLILTAGGISKGAYEVVRQALAHQPVEFTSVAMQPGGPQAIGLVDSVPFIGFPGNPVSGLVSFEMFLRPALAALTGCPRPRPELTARLAGTVASPSGKYQVRRGVYSDDGSVRLVGGAGSHLVHALAEANALVHIPDGTANVEAGEKVRIWLLDHPQQQMTEEGNS